MGQHTFQLRGNSKCSCHEAIDAAGYISREELYSEYDAHTYKPDPKEDLVHSEIDLPENAPEEYKDRATLWNSVEAVAKEHTFIFPSNLVKHSSYHTDKKRSGGKPLLFRASHNRKKGKTIFYPNKAQP